MKFTTFLGQSQGNQNISFFIKDENGNFISANEKNTDKMFSKTKLGNNNFPDIDFRIERTVQTSKNTPHSKTLNKIFNNLNNEIDVQIGISKSKQISSQEHEVTFYLDFKFNPIEKNKKLDSLITFFVSPSLWNIQTYIDNKEKHYKVIPIKFLNEEPKLKDCGFVSLGHITRALHISTRSLFDNLKFLEKEMGTIDSVRIGGMKWVVGTLDDNEEIKTILKKHQDLETKSTQIKKKEKKINEKEKVEKINEKEILFRSSPF